jgi:hypothetical protein
MLNRRLKFEKKIKQNTGMERGLRERDRLDESLSWVMGKKIGPPKRAHFYPTP